MGQEIQLLKARLRQDLRKQAAQMGRADLALASAQMAEQLATRAEWQAARSVLGYAPISGEPDLWPLLSALPETGRALALPRFDAVARQYVAAWVRRPETDLVAGHMGILEPRPDCPVAIVKQLDFFLVPGLGFDPHGRRLGRGKGYYDRLLSSATGLACGVAMDWQVLASVPAEAHDRILDCILTPTRWIACRPRVV